MTTQRGHRGAGCTGSHHHQVPARAQDPSLVAALAATRSCGADDCGPRRRPPCGRWRTRLRRSACSRSSSDHLERAAPSSFSGPTEPPERVTLADPIDRPTGRSGRQALTALAAARLDDRLSGAIRHAVTEAVLAGIGGGSWAGTCASRCSPRVRCATRIGSGTCPGRVLDDRGGPPRGRRQSTPEASAEGPPAVDERGSMPRDNPDLTRLEVQQPIAKRARCPPVDGRPTAWHLSRPSHRHPHAGGAECPTFRAAI